LRAEPPAASAENATGRLCRLAVWSEATKINEAANAGNKFQTGNNQPGCNGPSF
jgi:hypothetical protein